MEQKADRGTLLVKNCRDYEVTKEQIRKFPSIQTACNIQIILKLALQIVGLHKGAPVEFAQPPPPSGSLERVLRFRVFPLSRR